jgi:uncharacterized protein YuzB (UPF0349 family)
MQKGTHDVYAQLDENPGIDVVDYECTNNCGLCSKSYFVLVDGEIVAAKNSEQLLEKTYKRIDKNNQALDE